MTRAIYTLFIYVCAVLPLFSASPLQIASKGISTSISVVSLSDGTTVDSYDADRLLVPASVVKCITAATAQLTLPEDFAFETTLSAHGEIDKSGRLAGWVEIVGGYDPTLGSRFFPDSESVSAWVVARLKEAGISSIAGNVVCSPVEAPEDALSPYWLVEDLNWEYGAGCFPINYCDNSLVKRVGRVANSNPAALLHKHVMAALEKAGITVAGKKAYLAGNAGSDEQETEWTYLSPSRDDVLRTMMHRSDNLYAEAMLRAPLLYGDSVYADIKAETAVAAEQRLWKARGVDLSNGRLVDGSGLAPVNRISARMLTDILVSMADSASYVGVFPTVGREGTVKHLLSGTDLEGRMVLKSGSMTGVTCYAGYKLDEDGRPTHAVAVMVNNFSCSKAKVRSAISDYLLRTFK